MKEFSVLFVRRSLILYVASLVLLCVFVDRNAAAINYLNYLKGCEEYLQRFNNDHIRFNQQKFVEGVLYYKKLAEYVPAFKAIAYANLGFCYCYLNEYAKAREAYRKAVEAAPGLYTARLDIGLICIISRDFKVALDFLSSSDALIPETERYYQQLAKTFQDEGKIDTYFQIQQLIGRLNFDKVTLPYNLGYVHFMLGNYQEAIVQFTRAIIEKKNFAYAYYYRGLCWRTLGRKDLYEKDSQVALVLKNDVKEVQKEDANILRLHFSIPFLLPVISTQESDNKKI